ncbi:MAG: DUF4249 family protein [Ferruginibacter sp.]
MKKWMIGFSLLSLISCEKNINFDLKESAPVLVVDGEIENSKAPVVTLTKSLSFFDKINPQLLAGTFVHDAEVFISNGTRTHKLKEYSYPFTQGYEGFYYSIDSADLATAFLGEFNKEYSLKIISEGKEYTANVGIPALATYPDSVWLKQAPQNPDTNKRVLFVKAKDPAGLGNYVRYFTKKNTNPFFPGENSVYNDEVIDGTTYEVQFPQGIDRNNKLKEDSNFFKRGDTVTLKFCNIERPVYIFWSTWEFAYQSIGNPFAQPNKVIGNISNGALGAFCGYAAWYQTVIAQ